MLVDEFQDTDPVQWDIMRRAFGDGDTTLVLIGDPKQAIYAFRGADVYAYLDAANRADKRATLEVNWRSDQGLIDAYDALFGGAKLGHEGIVYRRVRAADANQTPRLHDAPVAAPLRIRVVHRDEPSLKLTRGGSVSNASAREHVANDLAADLATLLSSNAKIEIRAQDGTVQETQRIRPGHVAVLVRTNRNAALVRDALDEVDIPAVINGAGSVFGTAPARDWLRLLEALERPSSPARAASAALTPFLGWTTERVASATEEDREELHRRLHQWARVLRVKGVASLTETVTLVEGLPQRVLQTIDGERELTDLRHVGQLLHAAATTEQLGAAALTAWLRQQIAAAGEDTSDEERSRRLESDAEAVQVLTIHRSKGLEFPIVYYPYLWEPGWIPNDPQPVFFHDPQAGDERVIDVGMDGPDFPAHQRQHEAEQRGEDLRLAYVALTRAQHQAVVWWAPSWDSRNSALGRLLFARDAEGNVPPTGPATPKDAEAVARFEGLALDAFGCVSVERATLGLATAWSGEARPAADLCAGALRPRPRLALAAHVLQRHHRRRLRGAGGQRARGARRRRRGNDVRAAGPRAAARRRPGVGGDARRAVAARRDAGRRPGRDLRPPRLRGDRLRRPRPRRRAAASTSRRPWRAGASTSATRRPRRPACAPPSRRRSARCSAAARCATSSAPTASTSSIFELPLVGGDQPTGRLTLAAIAGVLRDHLPKHDPLAGYAERLDDANLRQSLRGYLTGSIDLVVRADDRFAVVDYKTNWLGAPGEELTAWHYRPAALATEMQHAHYALQALLYTAALHRYLRWRLPGYDPERNLAGVLYLFLRGMVGRDTPTVDGTPRGVFAWRPPSALVVALSDVLDRGDGA